MQIRGRYAAVRRGRAPPPGLPSSSIHHSIHGSSVRVLCVRKARAECRAPCKVGVADSAACMRTARRTGAPAVTGEVRPVCGTRAERAGTVGAQGRGKRVVRGSPAPGRWRTSPQRGACSRSNRMTSRAQRRHPRRPGTGTRVDETPRWPGGQERGAREPARMPDCIPARNADTPA